MSGLGDTIFAKASGAGRAAIAVVRVTGPRASGVLEGLSSPLPPPRLASLRKLRCPATGAVLDEALVLWLPAPRSYTGEDSVELHIHGGEAVWRAVAEALVFLQCRPAEAGEFTRRAFLHGRLDLVQAEAINDLIAAETEAQRRQALLQAGGALSALYKAWTERAKRLLAHQEAAIEFELEDLPADLLDRGRGEARGLAAEIGAHLDDGGRGERLREGLSVVIIGAPNAGKSSLLNALLGRDAAIVSAHPGTTRDVVEATINLGGLPARIADTAGLRATHDDVEREGVRRAMERAEEADLLVAVFACDAPADRELLALVQKRSEAIIVMSKCDLGDPRGAIPGRGAIRTSARTGEGILDLKDRLARHAAEMAAVGEAPLLTRARHRAALREALRCLGEAGEASLPEVVAEGYRAATRALGRLTGQVGVEDVLDVVFADFCIGK